MLALAVATLAVTAFAMRAVQPLFALAAGSSTADASPANDDTAPRGRSRRSIPGLPEALLSGVGFGTFFVFIYRAQESAGHWPLVSARLVSVVMFAIGALVTSSAVLPERPARLGVIGAGVLDAAAAVSFVLATRAGLLSIGAVLASLYPAVTVILARLVTKERIALRQYLGLALALGAVALLAA
jgi:drug/metabolite transporter (DMT)-like permease